MIRLSESAAEVLRESIIASSFGAGKTLRLSENESGFFLEDDGLGMNDRIVQHKGMPILLIDLRLEERIGDGMIDIDSNSDNPFLFIRLAEWEGGVRQGIRCPKSPSGNAGNCEGGGLSGDL